VSKKTSRRFLLAAFILSIVLHLAGGRYIRWPQVQREETIERVSLRKRLTVHVRPAPQQSPTARAKAVRPISAPMQKSLASTRPRTPSQNSKNTSVRLPAHAALPIFTAPPPASPSPVAMVRAAPPSSPAIAGCTKPNQPAAIVNKALPVISKSARVAGTHGIARVHVTVSADATVTDARLTDSSQNHELDLEALDAARASTYAPATANCKTITGETDYAVEFVPF